VHNPVGLVFKIVVQLQKRYYGIIEKLDVIRPDPSRVGRRVFHFDIEHERLRKEQLEKLYNRKPEEVEEEEWLRNEVRRINAR
jgi:DNA methyltransferase 1-associated protein 1